MNDLDYSYLRALPNYLMNNENYWRIKGKTLKLLFTLTGLKTWKSILEKWEGFSLEELIFLNYENIKVKK
jgi:hypothetical protein